MFLHCRPSAFKWLEVQSIDYSLTSLCQWLSWGIAISIDQSHV